MSTLTALNSKYKSPAKRHTIRKSKPFTMFEYLLTSEQLGMLRVWKPASVA